jgi:SAM-dependent methyltransferase
MRFSDPQHAIVDQLEHHGRRSTRAQFEFERQLRRRLLTSDRAERAAVVAEAYGELFERFPNHGVFLANAESRRRQGRLGAGMIAPLCERRTRVLEIGCGRGDVLAELAQQQRICVGIEPSGRMIQMCPAGVEILPGTAEHLDFPDESFDLVFSMQVLEHMHPDDVPLHLREALRVLRPGGCLAVETPNRRTGPQDISRGFTRTAQGLHLKEWSVTELAIQLRRAGFVRCRGLLAPPFLARRSALLHRWTRVPIGVKRAQDVLLGLVPGLRLRTLVGKLLGLDDIFIFGRKPAVRAAGAAPQE